MVQIDIRIEDTEIRQRLARLSRDSQDLSPAMARISEILVASTEDAFANERSPDGTPWAPLADTTLKRRQKAGRDGPILQITRDLLRSIDSDHDRTSAVAGTNLIYAATHQFGHEHDNLFGRGIEATIPARPFLGLRRDYVDDIVDVIIQHLTA